VLPPSTLSDGQIHQHADWLGLLLVAAGIALGLVGALSASRLLQQLLFEVAATDTATYVAVSVFFAVVALVACLMSARKALEVNPVNALLGQ